MNIGIDLDGVVFDSEIYNRAYADYFDYTQNGGKGNCLRDEAHVQGRYSNWPKEMTDEFMRKFLLHSQEICPLVPLAKEIMTLLRKRGHRLVLISNRGKHFAEEIDIAKKRIKKEGLKFDACYYNSADKLPACRKEHIDVMLDDYYKNIASLSENGITCIYFRGAVLKFGDRPNVIEVDTWGQVPKVIDFLEKSLAQNSDTENSSPKRRITHKTQK